jgi:hypothetical protein
MQITASGANRLMSALSQKQTFGLRNAMSGLARKRTFIGMSVMSAKCQKRTWGRTWFVSYWIVSSAVASNRLARSGQVPLRF